MTMTEAAFNINRRPVATIIELTLSFIARLTGARGADFYVDILPREEVKGLSFYFHDRGQEGQGKYDDLRMGRMQVIFSRGNGGK